MPKEVWRKEPPARPRRYDWEGITAKLKKKPGQWYLITDEHGGTQSNMSLAGAIKRKKMVALREPGWTFSVRTLHNDLTTRTAEVWMSAERKEEDE
jgi:hypothetical protein